MNLIAENLKRFREGVAQHDQRNPTHSSYGIGLAHIDMEKYGLEEGEQLWLGYVVQCDGGQPQMFRVLCDGDHSGERAAKRVKEEVSA